VFYIKPAVESMDARIESILYRIEGAGEGGKVGGEEDQVKLITSPKLFQDVLTPLIFSTLALLLDQTVALPALRSLIGSSMVLRVLPAPDGPRST